MKRKAGYVLLITVLLLVFFSGLPEPGLAQYPPPDNLPRYEIDVQLNTQTYFLAGKVAVTYYNTSDLPLSEMLFQLVPNALARKDPKVDE
ncbi:MAG: hypothetical protein AB1798_24165, partial [Spirochaetota bacterium]